MTNGAIVDRSCYLPPSPTPIGDDSPQPHPTAPPTVPCQGSDDADDAATQQHPPVATNGRDSHNPVHRSSEALQPRTPP